MTKVLPKHEIWKQNVEHDLDNLVANNFEKIYFHGSEAKIWGEIQSELLKKYGLLNISNTTPAYNLKNEQMKYIALSIEIYMMEDFPHNLSDSRTYRFVKQYGKLPKQLPNEWARFEPEQIAKIMEHSRKQEEMWNNYIATIPRGHQGYAYK